jgi:hypothetical protein
MILQGNMSHDIKGQSNRALFNDEYRDHHPPHYYHQYVNNFILSWLVFIMGIKNQFIV